MKCLFSLIPPTVYARIVCISIYIIHDGRSIINHVPFAARVRVPLDRRPEHGFPKAGIVQCVYINNNTVAEGNNVVHLFKIFVGTLLIVCSYVERK